MRVDRRQVVRELTFWLRPAFILRCARRFSKIEGFDRSIALASSAFTALIPLSILMGAVLPNVGEEDTAQRIIDQLDLSGAGAEAVQAAFAPAGGTQTSIGIAGSLLLVITVLSFARAMQRLVERTWGLPPLSVRNTRGGLVWIAGLVVYSAVAGLIALLLNGPVLGVVGAAAALAEGVVFLTWGFAMLSARRVDWPRLVPFALLATVALAVYGAVSDLWLPRMFDTYTSRYGVIGATFALISWLFGAMVLLVGAAAVGRELTDEVERVRRGGRASDEEVEAEWQGVREQAREARDLARARYAALRERWVAWRAR